MLYLANILWRLYIWVKTITGHLDVISLIKVEKYSIEIIVIWQWEMIIMRQIIWTNLEKNNLPNGWYNFFICSRRERLRIRFVLYTIITREKRAPTNYQFADKALTTNNSFPAALYDDTFGFGLPTSVRFIWVLAPPSKCNISALPL